MISHKISCNTVNLSLLSGHLLTVSFVKQEANLCFGKKFVARTVYTLLPGFLKPKKPMLFQMMGAKTT